jgi:hypothetical protein
MPTPILSTSAFNAPEEVIPTSITFGATGNEDSLVRWKEDSVLCWEQDTSRDGLGDLLCVFRMDRLGLARPDVHSLILKANTQVEWPIRGESELRVIRRPRRVTPLPGWKPRNSW